MPRVMAAADLVLCPRRRLDACGTDSHGQARDTRALAERDEYHLRSATPAYWKLPEARGDAGAGVHGRLVAGRLVSGCFSTEQDEMSQTMLKLDVPDATDRIAASPGSSPGRSKNSCGWPPPVGGFEELAVLPCCTLSCAYSTPFLWSCPKKRGGAPKKSAFGVVAPP